MTVSPRCHGEARPRGVSAMSTLCPSKVACEALVPFRYASCPQCNVPLSIFVRIDHLGNSHGLCCKPSPSSQGSAFGFPRLNSLVRSSGVDSPYVSVRSLISTSGNCYLHAHPWLYYGLWILFALLVQEQEIRASLRFGSRGGTLGIPSRGTLRYALVRFREILTYSCLFTLGYSASYIPQTREVLQPAPQER